MLPNSPKILIIRSDKSELTKLNQFLSEIFEENNLPQKSFNNVFLCISEAVVNSIEHGNGNNINRFVLIIIDYISRIMNIIVRDEGEGFNMNEVEDPTNKKNVKREWGRGIHIIKSLSENMEYNEKGNIVQFKIKFSE